MLGVEGARNNTRRGAHWTKCDEQASRDSVSNSTQAARTHYPNYRLRLQTDFIKLSSSLKTIRLTPYIWPVCIKLTVGVTTYSFIELNKLAKMLVISWLQIRLHAWHALRANESRLYALQREKCGVYSNCRTVIYERLVTVEFLFIEYKFWSEIVCKMWVHFNWNLSIKGWCRVKDPVGLNEGQKFWNHFLGLFFIYIPNSHKNRSTMTPWF